ncbi:MAG: hypothetical protein E6R13_03765 [Spirochaetes bacterium]|nr:MAG: hypothetical protein E6R13_03765 [Spirochaetota bacterium]
MAKRKTKAPVEPTFDIIETPVVAEASVQEMELEKVTVAEETVVEVVVEEPLVEVTEEEETINKIAEISEAIDKAIVKKTLSQKEMFEEAISKTPFTIYQNGILVCNYSAFLNIKTEAKYFEINNKKYSYTGIEFKYA